MHGVGHGAQRRGEGEGVPLQSLWRLQLLRVVVVLLCLRMWLLFEVRGRVRGGAGQADVAEGEEDVAVLVFVVVWL